MLNMIKTEKLEVEIIEKRDNLKSAEKYGIRSLPRLVIDKGFEFEVIQGYDEIIEAIKENL